MLTTGSAARRRAVFTIAKLHRRFAVLRRIADGHAACVSACRILIRNIASLRRRTRVAVQMCRVWSTFIKCVGRNAYQKVPRPQHSRSPDMTSVAFAVLLGTVLGGLATYWAVSRIVGNRWLLPMGYDGRLAQRVAWFAAIVAYPFMWFLGFVVGGNFGGGAAGKVSESLGLSSQIVIPFGIGLGILLGTTLLSIAVSVLGFAIARCIERLRLSMDR